jgi:hypothetical protein
VFFGVFEGFFGVLGVFLTIFGGFGCVFDCFLAVFFIMDISALLNLKITKNNDSL